MAAENDDIAVTGQFISTAWGYARTYTAALYRSTQAAFSGLTSRQKTETEGMAAFGFGVGAQQTAQRFGRKYTPLKDAVAKAQSSLYSLTSTASAAPGSVTPQELRDAERDVRNATRKSIKPGGRYRWADEISNFKLGNLRIPFTSTPIGEARIPFTSLRPLSFLNFKFMRGLKWGGAIVSLGLAGIDIFRGYNKEGSQGGIHGTMVAVKDNIGTVVGGAAGWWAGAWAGAAAGALIGAGIGTVIPFVGNFIGGVIGAGIGIAGGLGGAWLGGTWAQQAVNYAFDGRGYFADNAQAPVRLASDSHPTGDSAPTPGPTGGNAPAPSASPPAGSVRPAPAGADAAGAGAPAPQPPAVKYYARAPNIPPPQQQQPDGSGDSRFLGLIPVYGSQGYVMPVNAGRGGLRLHAGGGVGGGFGAGPGGSYSFGGARGGVYAGYRLFDGSGGGPWYHFNGPYGVYPYPSYGVPPQAQPPAGAPAQATPPAPFRNGEGEAQPMGAWTPATAAPVTQEALPPPANANGAQPGTAPAQAAQPPNAPTPLAPPPSSSQASPRASLRSVTADMLNGEVLQIISEDSPAFDPKTREATIHLRSNKLEKVDPAAASTIHGQMAWMKDPANFKPNPNDGAPPAQGGKPTPLYPPMASGNGGH